MAFVQSFKFLFFALLAATLIILSLSPRQWNPVPRIMNQKLLRWLGKISYGLYVFHPLVFYPVVVNLIPFLEKKKNLPEFILILLGTAVSLSTTILVSALSYKYYELPFLRLKKLFGGYQSEFSQNLER